MLGINSGIGGDEEVIKNESLILGHIHNIIYQQMMLIGLMLIIASTMYQHVQSLGIRKERNRVDLCKIDN